jgi:predicted O-methyltransferase YrrM
VSAVIPNGYLLRQVRRIHTTIGVAMDTFFDPAWARRPDNGFHGGRTSPGWAVRLVNVRDRPRAAVRRRDPTDLNMTDRQLAFVESIAAVAAPRRALEVGVYFGTTTCLLAAYGPTVAVDWWKGNEEACGGVWAPPVRERSDRLRGFLDAVDGAGVRSRVTVLTGNSHDVLPLLSNDRFGLALVDGDHSEAGAYADVRDVWPTIAPGGWLLLDDYTQVVVAGQVDNAVQRAWERFSRERGLSGDLWTPDPTGLPKLVAVRKPGGTA